MLIKHATTDWRLDDPANGLSRPPQGVARFMSSNSPPSMPGVIEASILINCLLVPGERRYDVCVLNLSVLCVGHHAIIVNWMLQNRAIEKRVDPGLMIVRSSEVLSGAQPRL